MRLSKLVDKNTPLVDILVNSELIRMEYYDYLITDKGLAENTAAHYSALIKSMFRKGDIRLEGQRKMILESFAPKTRFSRLSMISSYLEFIGMARIPVEPPKPAAVSELTMQSRRRERVMKVVTAALEDYLEVARTVPMIPIEEFVQNALALIQRNGKAVNEPREMEVLGRTSEDTVDEVTEETVNPVDNKDDAHRVITTEVIDSLDSMLDGILAQE